MANVNTGSAWYNLPAQTITGTTEVTLLVPASAGTYPGLPSPLLAGGVGLFLAADPDISGAMSIDSHPIKLRIAGIVSPGASTSFTPKIYLGTYSTTTSNTAILAATQFAATTASYNFIVEAELIWDSTSQRLSGNYWAIGNGVYATVTNTTQLTTITGVASLAFIPSFAFSTANASNSVTVKEFTIDRA